MEPVTKELVLDVLFPGAVLTFDLFMLLTFISNIDLAPLTSNAVLFLTSFLIATVIIARIQSYILVKSKGDENRDN